MRVVLAGGLISCILASVCDWLLATEYSPFSTYAYIDSAFVRLWALLNLPSYLIGLLAAGNSHEPDRYVVWVVFYFQWLFIGLILSYLFKRIIEKSK